ncbi:MAG: hypothetical protein JJT94_11360 [Bernardetiaceae bacterium]|nr:hypothetical protein [Bernardetiaceae bacterium]
MDKTIKGIFKDGKVILQEAPPTTEDSQVLVMFVEETSKKPKTRGVRLGSLAGKGYSIPDDFNAPLDDLKDYM